VTLVLHPQRPQARELAQEAVGWLTGRGHRVVVPKEETSDDLEGVQVVPADHAMEGSDLAVSLGGDGTMLRTVQLASGTGVPVLGVNLGQLGYLTSVEPSGLADALERFLAGDYQLDERIALRVRVERAGAVAEPELTALNEAVLEKTVPGHTVRLGLSLSGEPFITYAADGLIVSTPTGSTAYNLSARGPILSPGLDAILVTPVSPHMLFDRSLVLDSRTEVRIGILPERRAVLVVDGVESAVLDPDDAVVCTAGPRSIRLVRFDDCLGFHAILKAKFGLSDR
jgi:NAD+ kinase